MEMRKITVVLVSIVLLLGVSIVVAQDGDIPEDFPLDELSVDLEVQSAYNDTHVFFNFRWETEEPYWHHDYFVYEDGEWARDGFTEDRLRIMFGHEDLKGYGNFGGWITAHEGMRGFENEIPPEEVEEHPWLGEELGQDDVRKYIPQSREGEWWEAEWDEVRPEDELKQMKEDGEFLDLWTWRAHRSNPVNAATDHYVLEYRHDDDGEDSYSSQDMDPSDGPQYMFDTDHEDIDKPVLEREKIEALKDGYSQDEIYYLLEEYITEFDEEVIEEYDIDLEDAAIPRRVLTEPSGSAGVVESDGHWDEDTEEWNVELSRELDTGYEDDIPFEEGETYTIGFSPGKSEVSGRWHHTSYPIEFSLDQEVSEKENGETRGIQAEYIGEEEELDWDEIETHKVTCIYPGHITWQWIIDEDHAPPSMIEDIKNDEISKWDLHPDPKEFVKDIVRWEQEEGIYDPEDIVVHELKVNGESEELTIEKDEDIVITAELENQGDETETIALKVGGDPHYGYEWELEPGEEKSVETDPYGHGTWWTDEFTVSLGEEEVTVIVTDDVEDPDIEVKEFTVNGETEDVHIDTDGETIIYAEVSNHGDFEVQMTVEIKEDGEDIRGPHDYSETIEPGTTGEIEEVYDPHPPAWYEGEFEVILVVDGEVLEIIDVTVGESEVDPDEVDWDDVRFMGGMIIAAFIIGFGAGFLFMKKKTENEEK